jgi:hypothetical protein
LQLKRQPREREELYCRKIEENLMASNLIINNFLDMTPKHSKQNKKNRYIGLQ